MQLSEDPEIALLGIYPREMKTYVHIKTSMFLAALFIIAKNESAQMSFSRWMVKQTGTSKLWNIIQQ